MKREIKFRGRKNSTKEWIYGSLITDKTNGYAIVQIRDNPIYNGVVNGWCFGIEKGTEGQFTGLKDKNGVEIFEGDYAKTFKQPYEEKEEINLVVFDNGLWKFKAKGLINMPIFNYKENEIEVIGNIYENPELLK